MLISEDSSDLMDVGCMQVSLMSARVLSFFVFCVQESDIEQIAWAPVDIQWNLGKTSWESMSRF